MKRLLLDLTSITNEMTGVSRYGLELVRKIIQSPEIHLSIIISPMLSENHELFKLIKPQSVNIHFHDVKGIGPGREFSFFRLAGKLNGQYDVFHSITSNAPLAFYKKGVGTFHDLKYILYPQYMGKFGILKSTFIKIQFALICFLFKKITCSSESTLRDLLKVFPWMASRIKAKTEVVYLGLTPLKVEKLLKEYPIQAPYFIYVGELRPHKNILNMIEAFKKFADKTNFNGTFLIGGKPHPTLKVNTSDSRVKFLGRIDDNDLGALYKNSLGLFFATNYEGFGLPILEAMNLQVPVITSSVSSMPEVGGDAAIIVDPKSIDEMSAALEKLAFDSSARNNCVLLGNEQIKKFSWEKCAQEMIKIYLKA